MEEQTCDTCKYQYQASSYGPTCRRHAPVVGPLMPGELFLRAFWPTLAYGENGGCGEWGSKLEPTGEANKF